MKKINLLLVFFIFCSNLSFAQKDIKSLQKDAKNIKKKYGKNSLEYANSLLTVAEQQQAKEKWADALKTIAPLDAIIKSNYNNISNSNDIFEAKKNISKIDSKHSFLQAKDLFIHEKHDEIGNWINNDWYQKTIAGQDTISIKNWLGLIFNTYHSKSEEALAYWHAAYDNTRNDAITGTATWEAIQNKIAKDYGKNSDEYVGALFGQANFYGRIDEIDDYLSCTRKVEKHWGYISWNIPIPNRSPDTSHYKTIETTPYQIVQQYIKEQEKITAAEAGTEDTTLVEVMPRFPGCESMEGDNKSKKKCADRKMMYFVYGNISYPNYARINGIEGMVVIQFVINKKGCLCKIKAVKTIDKTNLSCSTESLRLVSLMNELPFRWTPGFQKNRAVSVRLNMPVRFKLN